MLARLAAPNGADQHRDLRPGEDHLETVKAAKQAYGATLKSQAVRLLREQPIVARPPLPRLVRDVVLTAFADSPEASRAPASRRASWG
jgi:hypothetical protein